MSKVSSVQCNTYNPPNVYQAVKQSIEQLGYAIPKNKRVFIKPNLLAPNRPEQHSITHYTIIDALCRIFSDNNCRLQIGDSVAFYQKGLTEKAFITSKLADVAKKYGAELVAFEQKPLVKIKANNCVVKEFYLPREIVEADLVIDACKLKTHGGGFRFSGAIKNLFGCIPGGYKQKLHIWSKNDIELCGVFVDLVNIIKPALCLMDAIVGMDGGPTAFGRPTPVGVILVSDNPAALDTIACKMIGYAPEDIPMLLRAKEIKMIKSFTDIELVGKVPSVLFNRLITGPVALKKEKQGIFISDTFVYPYINNRICNECNNCIEFCPVQAIINTEKGLKIDYNKCLHCYYCLYACPQKAFRVKSTPTNKFIRTMRFLLRL